MGNASYVNRELLCQFGKTKRVYVKSHPGGLDSRIFVNEVESRYRYGPDGLIYSCETGKFVSDLPIEDFARNYLWERQRT